MTHTLSDSFRITLGDLIHGAVRGAARDVVSAARRDAAHAAARKASRDYLEVQMALLVEGMNPCQSRDLDSAEMALWECMLVEYSRVLETAA